MWLIFITLKMALRTTAQESPAAMSPTETPSFCACLTLEFMKTVQRVPRSTGEGAARAAATNSARGMRRDSAKFSMKEPQPAEQASLRLMRSMTPSRTRMHLMS